MGDSSQSELKQFNYSSFVKRSDLGRGSFGCVELLHSKELKELVVGKFFVACGDQRTIEKDLINATREAHILAQIKHLNIVRFIGITSSVDRFGIILEYVCCGNLENFLLQDTDISIPWSIRLRIFAELADALDYLHNKNPPKSYIHGDLKPQNVLLTDTLQTKLADFGAATIAKFTGATSKTINGSGNAQHTPYYTAPEYLKFPSKHRQCSMDVYSYGMIGYEIITRKAIFSESKVGIGTLICLISETGQKPCETSISVTASTIENNSKAKKIFDCLSSVMRRCWQTTPEDRPKIADVKQDLNRLAHSENIFDEAADAEAKYLVDRRKLKSKLKPIKKVDAEVKSLVNRRKLKSKLKPFKKVDAEVKSLVNRKKLKSKLKPIKKADADAKSLVKPIKKANAEAYSLINRRKLKSKLKPIKKADANSKSLVKPIKKTEAEAYSLINRRKLKSKLKPTKKPEALKRQIMLNLFSSKKTLALFLLYALILPVLSLLLSIFSFYTNTPNVFKEEIEGMFLLVDGKRLEKFDISENVTVLADFPDFFQEQTTVQNIVKLKNLVYIISCLNKKTALRTNLSKPALTWNELEWGDAYKNRKYISFKDSIMAIGTQNDYMDYDCQHPIIESSLAFLYNTTTGTWLQLPDMNEARLGHALVVFKGSVCAMGGSGSRSAECFNQTTNKWTYLPAMNSTRRDAVAVELSNELYVIGGTASFSLEQHSVDQIKKYYSRYAKLSVEKYNPVAKQWTTVAKLNEARVFHGAGVFNGKIVVVGGFSSVVEVYDPNLNKWRAETNLYNAQRYTRIIAA